MLFNIVRTLLIILEVFTCCALVAAILLQKSKNQGMGLAFGSGMGESLFGAQIGNIMTKITIILATVFLVNTAVLAMMGAGRVGGSSVIDGMPVEQSPVAPVHYPVLPDQGVQPMTEQPVAPPMPELPAVPDTTASIPVPPMPELPVEQP